jgi:hypothetical protein
MEKTTVKSKWKCRLPVLLPRAEGYELVLSDVWLNAAQAALKLKISERKFNYWKKHKVFPYRNEGGTFSYNEAEMDDLNRRMYHNL